MESLDYNYFEIDNNIVITRRIINTPQAYAEYNLTRRLQEWLPKDLSQAETKACLMSSVTPKMLKEVLNGSDVTAKDQISSSGNSYADDHQSSRSVNRDIGH